jgi:hypothetical protein
MSFNLLVKKVLKTLEKGHHKICDDRPLSLVKETIQFEIFHEQLPLPVPCYDLLPVIELTVGRHMGRLRVFPTPLS